MFFLLGLSVCSFSFTLGIPNSAAADNKEVTEDVDDIDECREVTVSLLECLRFTSVDGTERLLCPRFFALLLVMMDFEKLFFLSFGL